MTYDTRVVLSDETVDADIPAEVTARVRFDLPGLRVAVRFGDRTWRVMASVPKELSDEDALSLLRIAQRLRELFGDAQLTTEWSNVFRVHRRHAANFVVGRVVLAGDAAHLSSPAGGQGMNAGIQDAGKSRVETRVCAAQRAAAPSRSLPATTSSGARSSPIRSNA